MITYTVYAPGCTANPTDRWMCEVRSGGWIADWQYFQSRDDAETWGLFHDGEFSDNAKQAIGQMAERWAHK